MKNKIFAWVMMFTLMFGTINPKAFAETGPVILVNESFNQYATNTEPTDWNVVGASVKVIEENSSNKVLKMENTDATSTFSRTIGAYGDYYVLSLDVKYDGAPVNLSIGLGSSKNPSVPIKIENNVIKSYDDKIIGSIRNTRFTTIAMVVTKNKLFSVYLDGRETLSNWQMPATAQSGELVLQKTGVYDTQSVLYLDNIRMYQAKRIYRCIPNAAMNPDQIDQFGIDDDIGDYLYFDSHDMNTSNMKYENFTAAPKTNELVCGRFDKTNPDRDESIYMKKTTDDDCFFDIGFNKHAFLRSQKNYSYFLVEGDFTVKELKNVFAFIKLRDNTNGNQDTNAVYINPDGSIKLFDGSTYSNMAQPNKTFNLKLTVDLVNHTSDVYVNDELIRENMPINASMNNLKLLRFGIDIGAGSGEIYVKDFRVTGLQTPYKNGVETKTSVFADTTKIEEYLKDKIAFSGYSSLLTVNGEKSKISPAPIMENDDLYVSTDVIYKAFGITQDSISITNDGKVQYDGKTVTLTKAPKEKDGVMYVPVLTFGSEVFGKYTFSYKTGLYMLSDSKMAPDTNGWDYLCMRSYSPGITQLSDFDQLNNYLSFERPSAEKIKEDFNNTTNNGAMHPRILATQDTFDQIKTKRSQDTDLDQMVTKVLNQAKKLYTEPVLEYKFDDSMRMLNTAKASLERMELFGFAWKITGESKWGDRAWLELEALSKFPDFNTSHIIDTGEFNMALAVGYDWFYDYLSDEQKTIVSDTILNKALKDLADGYYGRIASTSNGSQVNMAFKWTSNYNAIINGGALNAALAVAEVNPEYCFDVVEKGLRSLEYTAMGLMPGGGWSEGIGYWSYTWEYLVNAVSSLMTSTGTDYSMLDAQGIKESLNYYISLCGPQGMNNFHDCGETSGYTTNFNYAPLAKFFNEPSAFAIRKDYLVKTQVTPGIFDVLFYNFDADASSYDDMPKAIKTNGVESVSFRSTYDWEAGGMYASAHFGATGGYHSHNDTGTFVYDILGYRWAMDLGMEDYNLTNELGIPEWQTYRRRAEGHNICVINPGERYNQVDGKFAQITDFESNEYGGYVIANMDGIYADADTMKTGYYIGDNMRSLTVRNEIDLNKKSTIYWFMHTQADVAVNENNEVILSQGQESVKLRFATNAQNAEVSVMDAKPLPTSPNPEQQNQNAGIRKVAIKLEASGHLDLTVNLAPMGESAMNTPLMDIPMSQWTLPQKAQTEEAPNLNFTVMSAGSEVSGALPCFEGEPMPEIQVVTEDPNAVVEIQQAETPDEVTLIKVSDSAGKYYKENIVSYIEVTGKSINMFDQLPISDVQVSSTPEAANHKDNMLDGSFATRWTCMGKGEYAVFDLGEVKDIDGVAMAYWKGSERHYYFDILVSEDGKNYTSVYPDGETSGTSETLEVFDFNRVKARYVKFIGNGNSGTGVTNVNSNILEFRVLKNKYE